MIRLNRLGSKWDRETRNKINENWDILENGGNSSQSDSKEALSKANEALINSTDALTISEAVRQELNNIIIESGTSDAEVLQARGTFDVLNDRLTTKENEFSKKISDITNKTKIMDAADGTDVTSLIVSSVADSNIKVIDLANRNLVVSSSIEIKDTIITNGVITLKNSGQLRINTNGYLKDMNIIVNKATFTSPSAIAAEKLNGYAINVKVFSDNTVSPVDAIAIHVNSIGVANAFNFFENVHIRGIRRGIYLDSTSGFVTGCTFRNVRVDYFEEYAIRIGADSGNEQNSQHNIEGITIQDTSDNTEASNRVGIIAGGTWNNISKVITFADRPVGTFKPLTIPALPSSEPSYLLAYLKTGVANSISDLSLEGNTEFNGLGYVHNITNMRLLRTNKVPLVTGGNASITYPDTTNVKPLFTLKDMPTITFDTSSQQQITNGTITWTYENGIINIKNNGGISVSFIFYIKVPSNKVKNIVNKKHCTALIHTNNSNGGRLRNASTGITTESVLHLSEIGDYRVSAYACGINDDVITAANADNLYYQYGIANVPGNKTVVIDDFQFYHYLVPIINKNTIEWYDSLSLLS